MTSKATILSETACRLGEGPTYDPATDTLFWFDILGQALHERQLGSGAERRHALPMMASALAVVDADRQLLATEVGLFLRQRASGELTLVQPIEADNPATRSNDARVHPCGAFWIGTMGKKEERGAGAFYWFMGGELRTLFTGVNIPNATCFSPDGTTAYFTGLVSGVLHEVTCDPGSGLPTGKPRIFRDHRGEAGAIDGAVVDAEGVIWNALWGAGRVDAYSAAGGLLESVPVPARKVSCPAFVGANADRLAVTSAWEGMSEEERAADPHAGKTFLLDIPVRGRLEPKVLL
jgi:sugar lactone lactonase YvrE